VSTAASATAVSCAVTITAASASAAYFDSRLLAKSQEVVVSDIFYVLFH
jgi:hypothetical protein